MTRPKNSITVFHANVVKVLASGAVALSLPVLAYTLQNGPGDNNNGADKKVYSVPEGGPGIVLFITTIGAVLLFSTRRPSKA